MHNMTPSTTDFDKVMEELIQLRSEVAHQKEVQKQKESFDVVMKQMLAQRDTEREKQQEELRQERLRASRELQEELRQLVEKLHYLDALNLLKDSFGEELLKSWKQKLNKLVKIYF